ncbi:MAG: sensor histidine kinase [Rubrivivax sp.]|nr:MAG: sensor histidine kinase [Rubrivivax sp.]
MASAGSTPFADEAHWLERLPEAVLVVENGAVAYANCAARNLFDPAQQRELTGEPASRLLPEAAQAERLDGRRFPVALSSESTTFESRSAILHVVRDTEYEQALEQRLESKRRRVLALSGRIINVQEHERRHIARELHDEIGQCLSAIRVQFAKLQRRVEQPETLALINSAASLTESTLGRVRSLALLLHPPQLETLGLVAALRWHLTEQKRLYGLHIHFNSGPVQEPVPPDVAIAAYRILQEALSNALRHGKAAEVTVALGTVEDALTLTIMDDGVGFNPDMLDSVPEPRLTLGLLSMTERARLLGGELSIISAPGKGTRIAAVLPLKAAHPLHDQASSDPGR